MQEPKHQLVQKIIHFWRASEPNLPKVAEAFTEHFFTRASYDFVRRASLEDLCLYVKTAWSHFYQHKNRPGVYLDYKIIAQNQPPRLMLTMINDDRPYIVDSIQSLMQRWGLRPQFMVHPVIGVERDGDYKVDQIFPFSIDRHKDRTLFESTVFIQIKNVLSDQEIERFVQDLKILLQHVAWVVDDHTELKERLFQLKGHLSQASIARWSPEQVEDACQFLDWLQGDNQGDNFVFLGARYFAVKTSSTQESVFCTEEDPEIPSLGLLKDEIIANADDLVPGFSRARIVPDQAVAPSGIFPLVTVMKTNHRSPVHRHSRIDSIEVMDWSHDGHIQGVYQFIGIFTKEVFATSAFDVPILSRKIQSVFDRFDLSPDWHDGRALIGILDSIPRDEMFYLNEDEMADIGQKVLQLGEETNLLFFVRPDQYGRYLTAMVYLPRERYSFFLKEKFSDILADQLKGTVSSSVAHVGDLPFARVIYVLTFDKPRKLTVDVVELENLLMEASLSWQDLLERHLNACETEERAAELWEQYRFAFPTSYQEKFATNEAREDIHILETISKDYPIEFRLYSKQGRTRAKIFHHEDPVSLSKLLPILKNMGLKVASEMTFPIDMQGGCVYIHDFEIEGQVPEGWENYLTQLHEGFQNIWLGRSDNDGFNQLILYAGTTVRQVNLLRSYSRFLLQIKLPYSPNYIETAFAQYPLIAKLLINLFEIRFHLETGSKEIEEIIQALDLNLQNVTRLDHERIFRRFINAIQSTVRTNYYQKDENGYFKDYLSFKFKCADLDRLPEPRPLYEIFIFSARLEAIHLRGGKVARGGIRWSDRLEDYRTEVLGLMKAQMVKNSVIVPLGSKGGFIVKRQAEISDRSELMEEVIACYQTMMRGLLDITDNLVDGHVVPPTQVRRYDDDDPYLVVAADKGTATFSDIANTISQEYNFWMDDAFASGGSAGYDHKKMAITSRGAWESAKRHFRELNIDVQQMPFTVVGIGDMAGDVFGNGMLRSKKIRMVAAFNHQHIFLDPNPDPETSFAERQRLFDLPRSTWLDYNPQLISRGGGVFDRSMKRIPVTMEVKELLNLHQSEIAPDDLIQAIIKAQVDMIWFGGIGTFVKASSESHADVGDTLNNSLRVNGKDIRARVIVEGANLGMTQKGRVEYALNGGLINTDAIDNSAGVDCSDHEVNIKILFNSMSSPISRGDRDQLLKGMTDEVAQLVLQDNYRQSQILTILQKRSFEDLGSYQSLIKILEAEVGLNPALEYLPDDEALERRRQKHIGLTRPELAVLLAYSKIALYRQIVDSPLVEDPQYSKYLLDYFPELLQTKFADSIVHHPLKKEIIATVLANTLINRVGPIFVYDLAGTAGFSIPQIVHGFFNVVDLLVFEPVWDNIDKLDPLMRSDLQAHAYLEITQVIRMSVLWLLHRASYPMSQKAVEHVIKNLASLVEGDQQQLLGSKILSFHDAGLPHVLAEELSVLPYYPTALDVACLVNDHKNLIPTAVVYFSLRAQFGFDWLSQQTQELLIDSEWKKGAQIGLVDDLSSILTALTDRVMQSSPSPNLKRWMDHNQTLILQVSQIMQLLKSAVRPDFGLIAYGVRQLQRLIGSS